MKNIIFLFTLFVLIQQSSAQSWLLTGNSGTTTSANFLGTTDNKGLIFRTNNKDRVRITAAGNVGIGVTNPAQKFDVNGNINIGSGFGLFMNNQRILSADLNAQNTFLGNVISTTGIQNTATGTYTLSSNLTGSNNTATGAQSLYSNTSGNSNTANGFGSLYANTSGNENTAIGFQALNFNTITSRNVAIGAGALYSPSNINDNSEYNTYNVAVGFNTLHYNQVTATNTLSGILNTATGAYALYYNTTGFDNTATGMQTLYNNTTGYFNVAYGNFALDGNTYGAYNTAVGRDALWSTSEASYNTAVGYDAGGYNTVGWNNVFVGANANTNANGYYNDVAIGQGTVCTDVSQARIGNSSTVSIGGYANWTNISDGRVKKNINQNVPGLAFINKLQPITYNLDLDAADGITHPPLIKDKDGKIIQSSKFEVDTRKAKEKIIYTGFIAQDVEKAAKSLNYDFSGVDAAKNDKDLYGLRYAEFVVPLVKAVQELSSQNSKLKSENEDLEKKYEAQQKQIDLLKTSISGNQQSSINYQQQIINVSPPALQQNIPNPFSNSTTISYSLPQNYSSAKIIITDSKGNALKEISLSAKGKGSVNLDASILSAGSYQYTLYVDGKMIATKQMIAVK